MNDFTKEELQEILEGLSWWLDGDNSLYSEALINKIQSMIDDFEKPCAHKNLRRVSLSDGHDYDICHNCEYIRQMR